MQKDIYVIGGMTCSACASRISKNIAKLPGVKRVNVNLLTNKMAVEYDQVTINAPKIIQRVTKLGFTAVLKDERPKKKKSSGNELLYRFISSLIFTIPIFYISMGMMSSWPLPVFFHESKNHFQIILTLFLLTIPVLVINQNYFILGFKNLIKRAPNMDSLIALGSSAAMIYGIYVLYSSGWHLANGMDLNHDFIMNIYFESAAMILTLITLGKYLEQRAKGKTTDAITKLLDLTPKTAILLKDNNEVEILINEVQVDDILVVKAGMIVPVDGIIVDGYGILDEAMLTGESLPVDKVINNEVIGGTINRDGYFKMRAQAVGNKTMISKIIELIEGATASKAPIAKLADIISSFFVPIVIMIAIISAVIWKVNGASFEFSLLIGISVLVISCPCALGLATPTAIMVGLGKGASNGILIKNSEALERLAKIDVVMLDKTGTITHGKPKIDRIISNNQSELLKKAASIEQLSSHPYAEPIVEAASEAKLGLQRVENFEMLPSLGIIGTIDGKKIYGGNLKLLAQFGIEVTEQEELMVYFETGKTVLFFAYDNQYLGAIVLADAIKSTSKEAIELFKHYGKEVIMLTGDNDITANEIMKQVGIDQSYASISPSEKAKIIRQHQAKGQRVLMVGDGINDAIALVQADVGMAIGSGTDIAIESADIVLIQNDLKRAVMAYNLSKAAMKNIKQNLFWAFFYNVVCIPLAAGILYPSMRLLLNPMIAAGAMSFSSICVLLNALRLRYIKFKE